MKIVFQNDTMFTRISLVSNTWMCWVRGEGEEEIANHGWSRVKSFSQETGAKGQRTPRIGGQKPKLHSKNQVQDAHDSPTQLPFFLKTRLETPAALLLVGGVLGVRLSPRAAHLAFPNKFYFLKRIIGILSYVSRSFKTILLSFLHDSQMKLIAGSLLSKNLMSSWKRSSCIALVRGLV